jgi:hypothetical protein
VLLNSLLPNIRQSSRSWDPRALHLQHYPDSLPPQPTQGPRKPFYMHDEYVRDTNVYLRVKIHNVQGRMKSRNDLPNWEGGVNSVSR